MNCALLFDEGRSYRLWADLEGHAGRERLPQGSKVDFFAGILTLDHCDETRSVRDRLDFAEQQKLDVAASRVSTCLKRLAPPALPLAMTGQNGKCRASILPRWSSALRLGGLDTMKKLLWIGAGLIALSQPAIFVLSTFRR